MSSTYSINGPHPACSCSGASEANALRKRILQLTEELEDLKRDKRSFRDSSDELRRGLTRLREELKELRRKSDEERMEKEKHAEMVKKLTKVVGGMETAPDTETYVAGCSPNLEDGMEEPRDSSTRSSTTQTTEVEQRLAESPKRKLTDQFSDESRKKMTLEYPFPPGALFEGPNLFLEPLPTPLASPQVFQTQLNESSEHPRPNNSSFEPVSDPRLRSKAPKVTATHSVEKPPPRTPSRTSLPSKPEVINVDSDEDEPRVEPYILCKEPDLPPNDRNYDGLMRLGERSFFAPLSPRSRPAEPSSASQREEHTRKGENRRRTDERRRDARYQYTARLPALSESDRTWVAPRGQRERERSLSFDERRGRSSIQDDDRATRYRSPVPRSHRR